MKSQGSRHPLERELRGEKSDLFFGERKLEATHCDQRRMSVLEGMNRGTKAKWYTIPHPATDEAKNLKHICYIID